MTCEFDTVEDFIEKHVGYDYCWAYLDDDMKESVNDLFDFYLEACEECEVRPEFTLAEFEDAIFEMDQIEIEANNDYRG